MNRFKMKTYSRKNSSYLKKAFIASNFNEMCRLCLTEMDLGLTPIIQDSPSVCYQEWIQYGVNVRVEEGDGMPPNICEDCLAMVEQTYLFKKKCKASDSKLREHLELIELNDEHRLQEMGFSDLEEDNNLFRRNEATQNNRDESNAIDSGGTDQNMETVINTDDVDDNRMLEDENNENDENDENDDEEENDCTVKDVTNTPNEKKEDENVHVINGKKTKDTEQQTDNIPTEIEKKKSNEVKKKGRQGKIRRFILRGEKRITDDDDEEEDLSVFEVVPVDRSDDSAEGSENSEENEAEKNVNSRSESLAEKSVAVLKEIYDQWECDDSQQGEDSANTNDNTVTSTVTSTVSNTIDFEEYIEDEPDILLNMQVQNVTFENGMNPVYVNRIYQTKSKIDIIETLPRTSRYNCCMCPESFLTTAELKEHLSSAHEISDASSCEVCYKTFTCTNSLRRHMLIHSGFKPYKCRVCGRGFAQSSTLKRHVLTHEELKPFVCHHCNKSYTQKINLVSHMKTHGMISDDVVFSCKSCNKSFLHRSGLSRHVKEHRGFRFVCTHCRRSFVDPSALQRHVKHLHQWRTQRKTIMNLRARNRR